MSNPEQQYIDVTTVAHAEVQPLISAQGSYLTGTIQGKLVTKVDTLKALASDARIRGLVDLAPVLNTVNQVETAAKAIQSSVDAAEALQAINCGSYETGKNPDFPTAVRQYQTSVTATADLLKAASAILKVVALLPGGWPAALPAFTIGLLASEIEAIMDLVAEMTAICADIGSMQAQIEQDLADFESLNATADGQQIINAYVALPTPKPSSGGGSSSPSTSAPSSGGSPASQPSDPLILDLDGDGVELTPNGDPNVFFDAEGDGDGALTTWVDPDDGLLARDTDGNGLIETQAELFGDADTNAMDDLATQDSNGDGRIDARDDIWSVLRVWRDFNQDGDSDPGELLTMDEAGIVWLNLEKTSGNGSALADATALSFGNFLINTGALREMAAVLFNANEFFSSSRLPDGVSISEAALNLPQLHAMGQVADLRLAMTLDPDLLALVQDLRENGAAMSASRFHAAFEEMLWTWTGVNPADFANKDGFHDAFINTVMKAVPGADAGFNPLQDEGFYNELVDALALRFAIEVAKLDAAEGAPFNAFAPFINFAHDPVDGVISGWPETVVREIADAMPADRSEAMAWLQKTGALLSPLQWEFYGRNQFAWRNDLKAWFGDTIADLGLLAFAVESASAYSGLKGTAASDTIDLFHSHLMATTDSDILIAEGGAGDDSFSHSFLLSDETAEIVTSFIYRAGDGDDVIDVTGADHIVHRVFLTDIASNDASIRLGEDGLSPIIEFRDGGSITLTNVTKTTFVLEVYFSDGVVADQYQIISVNGDITNDTITGTFSDDQIDGGSGNDSLAGAGGNDTYRFFAGGDRDIVVEVAFAGDDVLWLHDSLMSDISVSNVSGDAVITFASRPSDRVTLQGQFTFGFFATHYNNHVETIRFADGSTLSADDLVELHFRQFQTSGDDVITGQRVAETFHIGDGEDTVNGGGGGDIFIRDAGTSGTDIINGAGIEVILEGVDASDVTLTKSADNLMIEIAGEDGIQITGQFGTLGFTTIGQITFGDGSFLTADEIARSSPPSRRVPRAGRVALIRSPAQAGMTRSMAWAGMMLWPAARAAIPTTGRATKARTRRRCGPIELRRGRPAHHLRSDAQRSELRKAAVGRSGDHRSGDGANFHRPSALLPWRSCHGRDPHR